MKRRPDLNAHVCVFCHDIVAPNDPIACPTHRVEMDKVVMPWEAP